MAYSALISSIRAASQAAKTIYKLRRDRTTLKSEYASNNTSFFLLVQAPEKTPHRCKRTARARADTWRKLCVWSSGTFKIDAHYFRTSLLRSVSAVHILRFIYNNSTSIMAWVIVKTWINSHAFECACWCRWEKMQMWPERWNILLFTYYMKDAHVTNTAHTAHLVSH